MIAFDCIGRRGVLGDERIAEEVERIRGCVGGRAVRRPLHLRRDRPRQGRQRAPQPDLRRPGDRLSAGATRGGGCADAVRADKLGGPAADRVPRRGLDRRRRDGARSATRSSARPRRSRPRSARSSAPTGSVAATGFGLDEVPLEAIERVVAGARPTGSRSGDRRVPGARTPIGDERARGARARPPRRARLLLRGAQPRRGMARMLALTVRLLRAGRGRARAARAERAPERRERAPGRVARASASGCSSGSRRSSARSSAGATSHEVLDAIVAGAAGAARRRDRRPAADRPGGPGAADDGRLGRRQARAASREMRHSPLGHGAGGRAAAEGRLIVVEDYAAYDQAASPRSPPTGSGRRSRRRCASTARSSAASSSPPTGRPHLLEGRARDAGRLRRAREPRADRREDGRGRDPPGVPRLAHRAAEPAAADRPPRAALARAARSGPGPRSCSSTSTRSRTSTTASATPPATSCCARPPSGCSPACAPPTPRRASAATSSSSCSRTSTSTASPGRRQPDPGGDERAVRDPGPRGLHRRQHRDRDRRRRGRRPAAQRRPRALPGEGQGQGPEAGLRARDARRRWSSGWSSRSRWRRRCASDELVLHYQPILELRSQRLVGVEALVRWQHPTRGLLLPGEFIPIAEDSRLMLPLGRWVLRAACMQAAAWRREPRVGAELTLSVNFSSAQFARPEPGRRTSRGRWTRAGCRPSGWCSS